MNGTQWLLVLGISLANNLDNTGVGIAYGAGRIRLSVPVNLWISVVTFIITAAGAVLGDRTALFLPPHVAKLLSAVILCLIGIYVMRPGLGNQTKDGEPALRDVLNDPIRADMDGSRHIDFKEGTLLGVALSINNFGGGVSAGLVHLSVFWTAFCSCVLSFMVLWLGGILGRRLAAGQAANRAPVVAGVLLIIIGLLQFR
ncbi:MAG: manganese efflux pump [Capsulimonadaceae bacterium]